MNASIELHDSKVKLAEGNNGTSAFCFLLRMSIVLRVRRALMPVQAMFNLPSLSSPRLYGLSHPLRVLAICLMGGSQLTVKNFRSFLSRFQRLVWCPLSLCLCQVRYYLFQRLR